MASGFGSKGAGNAIFFNTSSGKFKYTLSKDGQPEFCDSIWGTYDAHTIRWNEGNETHNVAAHDELVIRLKGSDAAGNTASYYITTFFPSSCAKMLVSCLDSVKPGMEVCIKVWPQTGGSGTNGLIYGLDVSENLVKLTRRTDAPKVDLLARKAAIDAAPTGREKEAIKKEWLNNDSERSEAWAMPILTEHPCWLDPEAFKPSVTTNATTTDTGSNYTNSNYRSTTPTNEEWDPFSDD